MLLGKQIIRKNAMTKRHIDPCLFLLGSVPTPDDIHIVTSKLRTNQQVLLAFIAKKDEFDQTKNKNPIFNCSKLPCQSQLNRFFQFMPEQEFRQNKQTKLLKI